MKTRLMKDWTLVSASTVTGSRTMSCDTVNPASASRAVTVSSSASAAREQEPAEEGHPQPADSRPTNITSASPATIMNCPKPRPEGAAMRVADAKSRRRAHSTARSTRPPSSGSAGSRLKTSR